MHQLKRTLNYRLHKLGIITDWKYRDFCIELVRSGFNKSEPEGIEREKSMVWHKVLHALWAEGKGIADIAAELHLKEAEVSDLLFGILNPSGLDTKTTSPLSLVD